MCDYWLSFFILTWNKFPNNSIIVGRDPSSRQYLSFFWLDLFLLINLYSLEWDRSFEELFIAHQIEKNLKKKPTGKSDKYKKIGKIISSFIYRQEIVSNFKEQESFLCVHVDQAKIE